MEIVVADLAREAHRRAVVALTAAYALDPMGNGGPLPPEVLERLADELRGFPTTLIFLAYDGDAAIGIATCFLGFSTFAARPLVNVHDLAVLPERRGAGVATRLLAAVEARARELGCCKVTLEVLENNHPARRLYHRAGFAQATYTEAAGGGLFYAKSLK
ncbi:MAG TPA: GNAT family N-acetyltransferase [Polyangia bacterium]|jgi:GNAT superfamily N-acetyltransferase|nr:GNAT family N-acetyltransferase [Polyangia bacterium]